MTRESKLPSSSSSAFLAESLWTPITPDSVHCLVVGDQEAFVTRVPHCVFAFDMLSRCCATLAMLGIPTETLPGPCRKQPQKLHTDALIDDGLATCLVNKSHKSYPSSPFADVTLLLAISNFLIAWSHGRMTPAHILELRDLKMLIQQSTPLSSNHSAKNEPRRQTQHTFRASQS